MKLYAAMMIGLAIGAGFALVMAARELEDAPTTTSATPAPSTPPVADRKTGATYG